MNVKVLPLRYRAVLAGLLFLCATVAGTWVSTLIGDDDPTVLGLVAGVLAGAALAAAVLLQRRHRRSRMLAL